MVDVDSDAVRRLHRVEQLSTREISRRTGLHCKTVRLALVASAPAAYARTLKNWICDQLQADPRISRNGCGACWRDRAMKARRRLR